MSDYGGVTPVGGAEPPLTTIGNATVSQHWVTTPTGSFPLKGTTWYVTDRTTVTREMPQWALIVAIVGFFVVCVFSLFFLLVKEDKVTGYLDVTVQGPDGAYHAMQIPVTSSATAPYVYQQIEYVRGLVTALG